MKKLCILLLLLLAGCAAEAPGAQEAALPEAAARTYAIVVKSVENPYMINMGDGFADACAELGAEMLYLGPGAGDAPSQREVIAGLIERGVDAIAVAANDMEEVSDVLQTALDAGISVVSLDSMVKKEDRIIHIQQASPEMIGRVLVQACAKMMNYEGEFALLTTTDSTPNQASWVRWMMQELEDNSENYQSMRLVETAYGLDEYDASAREAKRLLESYPDLRVIVAPTVVGMRAVGDVLEAEGSAVLMTGLGLPSEMERFIVEGLCPWMYLWNPAEVGYLAAYAADALVEGSLSGALGEMLNAGDLGEKIVSESMDGGAEIVLGKPKVFDMTNIAVWGELF